MRLAVTLLLIMALGIPVACAAQCPVNAGWWTYKSPDNRARLKFHVKPEGTKVDSLEFTLHSICSVSGTRRFTSSGKTITCAPWGFTWSLGCDPPSWTDGFYLSVTFADTQNAAAMLDIVTWFNGCVVCRALDTSGVSQTAESTWGHIKALYDSR